MIYPGWIQPIGKLPQSASFDQSQGDGNGDYYNQPPTASHFSRKRHSLDLLPGLQDALQSLRDGDVRHNLQKEFEGNFPTNCAKHSTRTSLNF